MGASWRSEHCVLVAEAHTIGSLATIRSLGRAGYRVCAASPRSDAIGFRSRYASHSCTHPPYEARSHFLDWLSAYVVANRPSVIIPSEGFLHAIRDRFREYASLLPVPSDEATVYAALSKWDLFDMSQKTGQTEHLPPFLLLDENSGIPSIDDLSQLGAPLFVKVDATHSLSGKDGYVVSCANSTAAADAIGRARSQFRKVLVQGNVGGIGVGAFLAAWGQSLLAQFMHQRIHEVPHTGGVSSFRGSWRHAAVLEDAKRRFAIMGWQGVGMCEYRWDPSTDRFFLLEFNSRFWGSLHLALYAGVDFPRLLVDAVLGHAGQPVMDYDAVRCRHTFPREVEYVLSCVRDPGLPMRRRTWSILEFFLLGLDPRVFSDGNFQGDRMIYMHMLGRTFSKFLEPK
jgi:hypothetical protein